MRKPIIASVALVVLMLILSIVKGNYEFIIYAVVLLPIVMLLQFTDRRFSYREGVLWGFAFWMAGHLAGGLAVIGSTRLYDLILIPIVGEPYNILKYDQILHIYFYVIAALLLGSVITDIVKKGAKRSVVALMIVFAACGVGAINEILEFLPVVLFNSPGPGGYINTALDICGNLIGAVIGMLVFMKNFNRRI